MRGASNIEKGGLKMVTEKEESYSLKAFATSNDAFDRCRIDMLIKNLRLRKKPCHGLEVGCGVAEALRRINDTQQFSLLIGLDSSCVALKVARKLSRRKVEYIRGDAQSLPFRNQLFDFVIAGEIIEHLQKGSTLVTEISRILRPHGVFVLSTPSGKKLSPDDISQGHVRLYYPCELEELLEKGGFSKIEITKWGFVLLRLFFLLRKSILHQADLSRFISEGKEGTVRVVTQKGIFKLYRRLLPFITVILRFDLAPTEGTTKHIILRAVKS